MTKADKMFGRLGYVPCKQRELCYSKKDDVSGTINLIIFYKEIREVEVHLYYNALTVDEHLAIHEKLKELGWIDE